MKPLYQFLQIGFKVFGIFGLGHPIDARRCLSSQPLKTPPQQFLVHQVKQTREL